MQKPFSPACEKNKDVILSVLRNYLKSSYRVLEVGSGTGQHGVYFAQTLPHLQWHMSDRLSNISGINSWVDDCRLSNVHRAIAFDVSENWPDIDSVDCVYSANTLHIMGWLQVQQLFCLLKNNLQER